jgi:hypothetical protein
MAKCNHAESTVLIKNYINVKMRAGIAQYSDWVRARRSGFYTRQEQYVFLCSTASTLGPTQPPIQWVLEGKAAGARS